MNVYVSPLWGFAFELPEGWIRRAVQDGEAFAREEAALAPGYSGPSAGHVIASAEWNGRGREVGPLWTDHLARVATMLGAKDVRSAPWHFGPASGVEAEIALPKKEGARLWMGMLSHDRIVLKLLVSHPLELRAEFEPLATGILRSLRFLETVPGLTLHPGGVPLPPESIPLPPSEVVRDLGEQGTWDAFETPHSAGAVQAFYWRESRAAGWQFTSFQPFPGDHALPFARVGMARTGQSVALGILPHPLSDGERAAQCRIALHWS